MSEKKHTRKFRRLLHGGLVGVTALAAVATLTPSAALAAPVRTSATAILADEDTEELTASIEDRIAAADLFGLGSDGALLGVTGDCNFVIGIWEYLNKRPASREARMAAEWAFGEAGEPCYDFIVTEAREAKRRDDLNAIAEAEEKRRSDTARIAAAAAIDVVADEALLSGSDGDFARRIWERVADNAKWIKVKAAARDARDGTAEQQRKFVDSGMADAATQDIEYAIIIDAQKTEEEKARLRDRAAKQAAANRIGLAVTEELLNLPHRDFIVTVWNFAPNGSEVQAAAVAATRSLDPAVWKAFIDTGVHKAKDVDIEKQLAVRDADFRRLTQEVLTRAERTGQRNLALAARAALGGTPTAREDFIRVGQTTVRPDLPDVLQAAHSGMCLAVSGGKTAVRTPVVQRVCNAGKDRGWKPFLKTGGVIELRNNNSGLCAAVLGASTAQGAVVGQWTCSSAKDQQWTPQHTAAGMRLRNVNSGLCLAVESALKTEAAPVVQRTCADVPQQTWQARGRGLVNLETGNLNGDAFTDLLAVDIPSNTLYLYPGTAAGGTWGARIKVGTGWNAMDKLVTGEFNRDAYTDLAAVEIATGKLWLYPGTATAGRFGTRVEIGSGWQGYGKLTVGAVNRDAFPDLVTVEVATGKMWLYPGTAAGGRFGARSEIGTGWNGYGKLAIGQVNRDDFADIITVENATGKMWLYPGTAAGGRPGTRVEIGAGWNGFTEVTVGNFNRDAYADILTLENATGRMWLYPGTAAGGRAGARTEVGIGS